MTEIPANCVLSKGITGCGATTVAIKQPQHTILAMPFVGLIDNKTEQFPNTLLGIYGRGDKTQEIRDYLETHETIKIATTFDSLKKVCETLEALGQNPYRDIHLAVDEWHVLFNSYDYRTDGFRRLLETAPRFDRVTYISATPIERKYYLEELKHLPECRIEWPNAKPVNIRSHEVDKPLEYMAGICRNKIAKNGGCNYHIFLNSVEDIASIMLTARLTSENTRVICSQSEEALKKNLEKLPDGFTISKASDTLKPISFYTSTCFEGQDIIDPNGKSFIVSGSKDYTKMDISTSLIQVSGRVRKSIHNEEIIHFYSVSHYKKDCTLEDFERSTYEALKEAQEYADWKNSVPESYREREFKQIEYMKEPFVRVVGNKVVVDATMANLEIINFKIINNIYQSKTNVINEMKASGINITDDTDYTAPESIKLVSRTKASFQELFDLYCEIKDNEPQICFAPDYRLELIVNQNSLVMEAYNKLGREEVIRLKYHPFNIRRELIKLSNKGDDYKIAMLVEAAGMLQKAIPISIAKNKLQTIYNELGLKKVAKATDLTN